MFCLTAVQAVCSISLITRKGLKKKGTTKQNNAYWMFNMFVRFREVAGWGGARFLLASETWGDYKVLEKAPCSLLSFFACLSGVRLLGELGWGGRFRLGSVGVKIFYGNEPGGRKLLPSFRSFFLFLFLPTTFTHTHTHDPRPTTFSYTPFTTKAIAGDQF